MNRPPQRTPRPGVEPFVPSRLPREQQRHQRSQSQPRSQRTHKQGTPTRYQTYQQTRYQEARVSQSQKRRKQKRHRWLSLWMCLALIGGWVYNKWPSETEHWFITEASEHVEMEQIQLPAHENEVALLQIIYPNDEQEVDAKTVKFATLSNSYKVINRVKPKTVSHHENYDVFELMIPQSKTETTLVMNYELNGIPQIVEIASIPAIGSSELQLASQGATPQELEPLQSDWLIGETSHLVLTNTHFFGENLRLKAVGLESGMTYQWEQEGTVVETGTYQEELNKGFSFRHLPVGHYALRVEGQLVKAPSQLKDVWYTVKREGLVKKIQLSTVSGFLIVSVEELTEAPDDVYDLLIDPGHGGVDGGATAQGKIEAEEVLAVSQYLAERFEAHGLKVKLTRDNMDDPSQSESHDYDSMPYLENGRVDQVYRYQPKYVISNHLNAFDGSLSGYELYSSIRTTDHWTSYISNALQAIGREARDSLKSEHRQSTGSYKKTYTCDQPKGCDLIYMIRETGGALMNPIDLPRFSASYGQAPGYGAESILIEYGYIDHVLDMAKWDTSSEDWAEAVVQGTLAYLEIPYQPLTD